MRKGKVPNCNSIEVELRVLLGIKKLTWHGKLGMAVQKIDYRMVKIDFDSTP